MTNKLNLYCSLQAIMRSIDMTYAKDDMRPIDVKDEDVIKVFEYVFAEHTSQQSYDHFMDIICIKPMDEHWEELIERHRNDTNTHG